MIALLYLEGNPSVKVIPSVTPCQPLKSKNNFEKSCCVSAELKKTTTKYSWISVHIKQLEASTATRQMVESKVN